MMAIDKCDLSFCVQGIDTSEAIKEKCRVVLPVNELKMLRSFSEESHRMVMGLRKYI